jgi:hypothetical protein
LSSEPAVTATCAPLATASWIAVVPIPLDPPCTSSHSPPASRPRSKTFVHTVKNVSGMAAASTKLTPCGTGRHWPSGATHQSA